MAQKLIITKAVELNYTILAFQGKKPNNKNDLCLPINVQVIAKVCFQSSSVCSVLGNFQTSKVPNLFHIFCNHVGYKLVFHCAAKLN